MQFPDNISADFSDRDPLKSVDGRLSHRWSPRSFRKTFIADSEVNTLFEAARWAPSCFNEQPWIFYVSTEQTFDEYLNLLLPGNQIWAKNASLLCFVVCHTTLSRNGKPNDCAEFDAGAAWMSLAWQARTMGLYTHGMAGIRHEAAASHLGLEGDLKVICAIAIGVAEDPGKLPGDLAAREKPSPRKPLTEILRR